MTNTEFQEMREQLITLKKELEKKTEVHEQVLHKLITNDTISFKKKEISSLILVASVALFLPLMLYFLVHLSPAFCLSTALFFIFALCWEIVIIRKYHIFHLMEGSLVQTAKNLRGYQRVNRFWLNRISPVFIIIWFTWYVMEYLGVMGITDTMLIICTVIILAIGGLIGGLIGYFKFYKPQMQKADEILNYIQELESEE